MNIISHVLPPVPDTGGKANFVLFFEKGRYYITCFDRYNNNVYPHVNIPGNNSYCYYLSDDGTHWILIHKNGGFHCSQASAIGTSETIYYGNGGIYLPGLGNSLLSEQATVIGNTLTFSTVYREVFGEVQTLIPIIAVVIIALIGFRKAWSFLSGAVRGA